MTQHELLVSLDPQKETRISIKRVRLSFLPRVHSVHFLSISSNISSQVSWIHGLRKMLSTPFLFLFSSLSTLVLSQIMIHFRVSWNHLQSLENSLCNLSLSLSPPTGMSFRNRDRGSLQVHLREILSPGRSVLNNNSISLFSILSHVSWDLQNHTRLEGVVYHTHCMTSETLESQGFSARRVLMPKGIGSWVWEFPVIFVSSLTWVVGENPLFSSEKEFHLLLKACLSSLFFFQQSPTF